MQGPITRDPIDLTRTQVGRGHLLYALSAKWLQCLDCVTGLLQTELMRAVIAAFRVRLPLDLRDRVNDMRPCIEVLPCAAPLVLQPPANFDMLQRALNRFSDDLFGLNSRALRSRAEG